MNTLGHLSDHWQQHSFYHLFNAEIVTGFSKPSSFATRVKVVVRHDV